MTKTEIDKLREFQQYLQTRGRDEPYDDFEDGVIAANERIGLDLKVLLDTFEVEEDHKCFQCKHGKRVVSAQCSYSYQDCDLVPRK